MVERAGLHAVLAFLEISRAKSRVHFQSSGGQIEATHYSDSNVSVTFLALEGRKPLDDPGFNHDKPDSTKQELVVLDSESEDLPAKLEQYLKKMSQTFYERELSSFMKPTLRIAAELSNQKKVQRKRFPASMSSLHVCSQQTALCIKVSCSCPSRPDNLSIK
jgi:hypothetical protein